ncbi:hypothetical protein ELI25_04100 [Rhizobium ruizarguesonis]|uniref:hypothetical protein n=1 Tax=Rhizobium ruizarguesonis TaxID=2081791 RepID=UPI00102FE58A|nr:hypothetical protein [Rhizobium ruizarguesonis]TAW15088.1 hypothetical protein ELI25_04100 [Rhizobium ruizarguesonis]
MTDAALMEAGNSTVVMGNGASVDIASIGGVSEAGTWISSQLQEMIASGDYTDVSVASVRAVLDIAHRIEHGRIDDDARKPTADILRYLSQYVLQRRVPLG